jgi:hypothetical protein
MSSAKEVTRIGGLCSLVALKRTALGLRKERLLSVIPLEMAQELADEYNAQRARLTDRLIVTPIPLSL